MYLIMKAFSKFLCRYLERSKIKSFLKINYFIYIRRNRENNLLYLLPQVLINHDDFTSEFDRDLILSNQSRRWYTGYVRKFTVTLLLGPLWILHLTDLLYPTFFLSLNVAVCAKSIAFFQMPEIASFSRALYVTRSFCNLWPEAT